MIRIHRDLCHQSLTSLQELRKAQVNIPTAEIIRKNIYAKSFMTKIWQSSKPLKIPKYHHLHPNRNNTNNNGNISIQLFTHRPDHLLIHLKSLIWIKITDQPTIQIQLCHGPRCQAQSKLRKGY
jgi:hypothetical protein